VTLAVILDIFLMMRVELADMLVYMEICCVEECMDVIMQLVFSIFVCECLQC
jgi:hypothetical protein